MSKQHRCVDMAAQICDQINSVFSDSQTADPSEVLVNEVTRAAKEHKRTFVYGVGREGLMLKAFCMRLFHLGLAAHAVGDMTTPPVTSGDLLIVSAGPGEFSTVDAISRIAKATDARLVVLTARPESGSYVCAHADAVAYLPAQTMADDEESASGVAASGVMLPMGSLYEGAMFVLFEMVVLRLVEVLGLTAAELRSRHTNLE